MAEIGDVMAVEKVEKQLLAMTSIPVRSVKATGAMIALVMLKPQ